MGKHLKSPLVWIMIAILAILGLGYLFSPGHKVTACELGKAFDDDEMAAISKYEDRFCTVTGTAGQKGDSFGGLWLQLSCDGSYMDGVQCFFSKGKAAKLAHVAKGQTVKVRGKCTGETLGMVILTGCSLK